MGKFLFLFRRAPEREDIPDDSIVAVAREEGDGRFPLLRPSRATRPHRRKVPPHREPSKRKKLAVRLAQIALERSRRADACHEIFYRRKFPEIHRRVASCKTSKFLLSDFQYSFGRYIHVGGVAFTFLRPRGNS